MSLGDVITHKRVKVDIMKTNDFFGLIVLFYLISSPAYAYVDPSAGSLWIQSLVGILATVGAVIRVYWHKIKSFFCKKNKKKLDGNHSV